jgi:hypothetical protein
MEVEPVVGSGAGGGGSASGGGDIDKTKPIYVLSQCDGISGGRLALHRLGYTNVTYFASEVKPHAIDVAQANFPDIIQIGDLRKVTYKQERRADHSRRHHLQSRPLRLRVRWLPLPGPIEWW